MGCGAHQQREPVVYVDPATHQRVVSRLAELADGDPASEEPAAEAAPEQAPAVESVRTGPAETVSTPAVPTKQPSR